jgi:hypothetical protein
LNRSKKTLTKNTKDGGLVGWISRLMKDNDCARDYNHFVVDFSIVFRVTQELMTLQYDLVSLFYFCHIFVLNRSSNLQALWL